MSEYYFINGKIEIYDIEKLRKWLFKALQEQEFVGTFAIDISKANKCVCEKCSRTCQEGDL